jgi:hypothetical protein
LTTLNCSGFDLGGDFGRTNGGGLAGLAGDHRAPRRTGLLRNGDCGQRNGHRRSGCLREINEATRKRVDIAPGKTPNPGNGTRIGAMSSVHDSVGAAAGAGACGRVEA